MERVHYANTKQVGFTHGSLFSGIGGFDLASQWMGWENVFHCEWNEFGRRVLSHYWPNAVSYGDITKTDFTIWRGRVDVLTGGFPCQPYSLAGKRKGKEDDRHLWPKMLRAIREIQPRWVVGENVYGIVGWNDGVVFEEVQTDLESCGYSVQPFIIPAAGVGAPHKRDRIWFVAHSNNGDDRRESRENEGEGREERLRERHKVRESIESGEVWDAPDNQCLGSPRQEHRQEESRFNTEANKGEWWSDFPNEPPICGRDDGFPDRLDGITFSKWRNESIKAYGNAVVPQVVMQIFKAIEEYEQTHQ